MTKVKTPTRANNLSLRGRHKFNGSGSNNNLLNKLQYYATRIIKQYGIMILLLLGGLWGIKSMVTTTSAVINGADGRSQGNTALDSAPAGVQRHMQNQEDKTVPKSSASSSSIRSPATAKPASITNTENKDSFLPAFQDVLARAKQNRDHCHQVLPLPDDAPAEPNVDVIAIANMTTARLHSFGVIETLEAWHQNPQPATHIANGATNTQCVVPPEQECDETQFSVIFMAYNPDRLTKLMRQIKTMLTPPYHTIIREIILVWNGPRDIGESSEGQQLLAYVTEHADHLRVVYPLKMGLPNDLMNRYHPDVVQVKTKGILYYDDDGPFYSYEAVLGGFELWKRNSNAQIGAMARVIDLGPRQAAEKKELLQNKLNDRAFVSHCPPSDDVEYNFRYFANFQANMVLPSGSLLHSNYLCFLWHPVFEPIRTYIRAHPVHPDDITVSMMVSQLAGRAPKVYSRRINLETKEDQLAETARRKAAGQSIEGGGDGNRITTRKLQQEEQSTHRQHEGRRKLLFNINWDANHNMDDNKEKWAQLRSGAINSLVRFFGSINSGSIGWCYGTEYHQKDKNGEDVCLPDMARFGKLPWMNIDHTPKQSCP